MMRPQPYGWTGNYSSWEEAIRISSGYDSEAILEKVKEALLKVKQGKAAYERDSVLFEQIEYSWPLLATLLESAVEHKGELNVLDFGGSLGSIYFQNREFCKRLSKVTWGIVEQEQFVSCGNEYFANDQLRFYNSMEECVKVQHPSVFLFSSVLQYIGHPWEVLQQTFQFGPDYIVIDKMPFLKTGNDRITVQKVDPLIYEASYPCWLLNRAGFLNFFEPHYTCVAGFDSPWVIKYQGNTIPYEGFIFRKK